MKNTDTSKTVQLTSDTQSDVRSAFSHLALAQQVTALEKQLHHANEELKMLTSQNQGFVTGQEKHYQELKKIEQTYQLLILASASIIWASDAQGAFTTTAVAWGRFTGQSYEDYQGFGWLNAMHADDIATFTEEWNKAKQTKSLYQICIRLYHQPKKDYHHVIMRAFPLLDINGEIVQWLGSVFDVTELKKQEDIMRADRERLNQTLKSAQVGTWYWDIIQDVMTWNGHIHPIFGREPGELKGKYQAFLKLVHEDNREQFNQSIQHSLESDNGFTSEFRIIWPDGSEHFIASRGETYSDKEGKRLAMSGICWDITELKLQEEKRIQALKTAQEYQKSQVEEAKKYRKNLEEFINLICHEIRNPLNGIMGSIEWLKDAQRVLALELDSLKSADELIDKISTAQTIIDEVITTNEACTAHQLTVVNDVLDLSKLEANKLTLDEAVFVPNKTIEAIANMYKATLAAKQLTCNIYLPDEILIVKGDAARFKTAIINLITNALKFTRPIAKSR